MSVIFCLLPTSNMCWDFKEQQWFRYFLHIIYFIDLREQQMWELWIHFSCLTLPLQRTPVNNRIKLISPETRVSFWATFCRWQFMSNSANFLTVLFESQKSKPRAWVTIPRQTLMQNGHSGSFKVICFVVNEKPLRDCNTVFQKRKPPNFSQ